MVHKNGKERKVKVKGFMMIVEEDGNKANVSISERALRKIFDYVPELNGKEIVWNSGQNKMTILYE